MPSETNEVHALMAGQDNCAVILFYTPRARLCKYSIGLGDPHFFGHFISRSCGNLVTELWKEATEEEHIVNSIRIVHVFVAKAMIRV